MTKDQTTSGKSQTQVAAAPMRPHSRISEFQRGGRVAAMPVEPTQHPVPTLGEAGKRVSIVPVQPVKK